MAKVTKNINVEVSYKVKLEFDCEDGFEEFSEEAEQFWSRKIYEYFRDLQPKNVGVMKITFVCDDYTTWNGE